MSQMIYDSLRSAQRALDAVSPMKADMETARGFYRLAESFDFGGATATQRPAVQAVAQMGPMVLPVSSPAMAKGVMFPNVSRASLGVSGASLTAATVMAAQAMSLRPLASSVLAAVAVEREPEEVFERAGDGDDEIVMLLRTLVGLAQRTDRPPYVVATTCAAVYAALVATIQLFGLEQTMHALQALAHTLGY